MYLIVDLLLNFCNQWDQATPAPSRLPSLQPSTASSAQASPHSSLSLALAKKNEGTEATSSSSSATQHENDNAELSPSSIPKKLKVDGVTLPWDIPYDAAPVVASTVSDVGQASSQILDASEIVHAVPYAAIGAYDDETSLASGGLWVE